MVDPPIPDSILALVKEWGPYIAAGITEEQLKPYLPVIKLKIKALPPEQRTALAIYLNAKAPALSSLVEKLLAPTHPDAPPPDPESQDLTEDEELKIARYTDAQLKEGNTPRSILATVNRVFHANFDIEDLQEIVDTYRVMEADKRRTAGLETGRQTIRDLQVALHAEQEAHLATKQVAALKYIEYREGIVVRWGASLAGVLVLGLALGRLLR